MKKTVILMLFALTSLFSASQPASNLPKNGYSWEKAKTEFYFDIELDDKLQFEDTHTTYKLQNGLLGAEVHCRPIEEGVYFSEENWPLEKVEMTFYVFYDQKNHLVNYELIEKFIFISKGWLTNSTSSETFSWKGTIPDLDLNTSERPVFYYASDSLSKGYFIFKR